MAIETMSRLHNQAILLQLSLTPDPYTPLSQHWFSHSYPLHTSPLMPLHTTRFLLHLILTLLWVYGVRVSLWLTPLYWCAYGCMSLPATPFRVYFLLSLDPMVLPQVSVCPQKFDPSEPQSFSVFQPENIGLLACRLFHLPLSP